MNAVALRKHYAEVRARLNTPMEPKPIIKVEPPAPKVKIIEQPQVIQFPEVDESVRAALHWPPKKRMLEVIEGAGVTLEDLRSDNRKKHVVRARWDVYYMLYTEFKWSLPKIGRYFNKDHTTVLHGLRSLAKETGNDYTRND